MANLNRDKLGWIGIGRMGLRYGGAPARAGCDIAVWNRTRAKAERLKPEDVEVGDGLS